MSATMVLQALSSPVSGILGDKYDRTHIVAFGCCLWGIMTAFIGLSSSIHQVLPCMLANTKGSIASKKASLYTLIAAFGQGIALF